jgi:hypothetical protein
MKGPLFDEKAKGLAYSLNGREKSQEFYDHTGAQIQYFPSLYGFSKQGRVVHIDGNPTRDQLQKILVALEKT